MHPHISYLICATPRSGSTLLCEALENTGLAGHPEEYFEDLRATGRPRRPQEYFEGQENAEISALLGVYSRLDSELTRAKRWGTTTYGAYFRRVIEEGTTPNDVFGAKVMWGYFDDFAANLRQLFGDQTQAMPDLLADIFPRLHYIRVIRRDKVRQAISLWKAIQTRTWKMDDASSSAIHELRFHFGAIEYLVQRLRAHEAAWQAYFSTAGIQPFTVVYEDLANAYEETAWEILTYLNIPVDGQVTFAERRMQQQADQLSEAWMQRYHDCKCELGD